MGKSVLGQDIVGIRISREVREERRLLKPMVGPDILTPSNIYV